jgi:hypothetical protein
MIFLKTLLMAIALSAHAHADGIKKGSILETTATLATNNEVACYTENGPQYRYSHGSCITESHCKFDIISSKAQKLPAGSKLTVASMQIKGVNLEIRFKVTKTDFTALNLYCRSVSEDLSNETIDEMLGWVGLQLPESHQ